MFGCFGDPLFLSTSSACCWRIREPIWKWPTLQVFRTGFFRRNILVQQENLCCIWINSPFACKDSFPRNQRDPYQWGSIPLWKTSLSYRGRLTISNHLSNGEPNGPIPLFVFSDCYWNMFHITNSLAGKAFWMELYILYLPIAQFGYGCTTKWTQPFVGIRKIWPKCCIHPTNRWLEMIIFVVVSSI